MIKVTIVGTGNVSYHLQKIFSRLEEVLIINVLPSRSVITNTLEEPDIYIIAVSDDAIEEVSEHFENSTKLIVHTSGSVPIGILPKRVRKGVFYPLQTFSKDREVDFKTIPICLEASESNDLQLLKEIAAAITDKVHEIDSEQRKALHLAAVFVNNFSNHLYQIGNEICKEQQLPFQLLKPLIQETAAKIKTLSPIEAQTGPAKRNDVQTINNHLDQLKNKKQREIYSILTESIQETYGEKL